jgi:hypothetical protein
MFAASQVVPVPVFGRVVNLRPHIPSHCVSTFLALLPAFFCFLDLVLARYSHSFVQSFVWNLDRNVFPSPPVVCW